MGKAEGAGMKTIAETIEALQNLVCCDEDTGCFYIEDVDVNAVVNYLTEYRDLLDGMAGRGIKKVTFDTGQEITINAAVKPVTSAVATAIVRRDPEGEQRWVCECGQGVGRSYLYCYHCGKKLSFDD